LIWSILNSEVAGWVIVVVLTILLLWEIRKRKLGDGADD